MAWRSRVDECSVEPSACLEDVGDGAELGERILMERILLFIPCFASGGAESFVVNTAESLVARGFRCNILCIEKRDSVYEERLGRIGIELDVLIEERASPLLRYIKGYARFAKYLSSQLEPFDIVHFNVAQGEDLPFVWFAKRAGVPVRLLHSHSSSAKSFARVVGHRICKALFNDAATAYAACSDKAAEWLFPRRVLADGDYETVKNGIATSEYRFDSSARDRVRKELSLEGQTCYLSVARLERQKNHEFLLDAFSEITGHMQDTVLLCVGEGSLKRELVEKSEALGLRNKVYWLGVRDDIPAVCSAADCFLLPSLFEGFPFSLVEAQASGLPCIVSDAVSEQCRLSDLVDFCPLNVKEFANASILAIGKKHDRRTAYSDVVASKGYDVGLTSDKLIEMYRHGSKA